MKQVILNSRKENGTLSVINEMRIMMLEMKVSNNTEVLKSNRCDYNDAQILVRGDIAVVGRNLANKVAFKTYALFTKYMTKIDGTTIDDAKDLDLVMPMYNLLQSKLF